MCNARPLPRQTIALQTCLFGTSMRGRSPVQCRHRPVKMVPQVPTPRATHPAVCLAHADTQGAPSEYRRTVRELVLSNRLALRPTDAVSTARVEPHTHPVAPLCALPRRTTGVGEQISTLCNTNGSLEDSMRPPKVLSSPRRQQLLQFDPRHVARLNFSSASQSPVTMQALAPTS